MADLETRLAEDRVLILDGGTGTELERRGVPMHDVAWSAGGIIDYIDILRQVHEDYIRAGADVIIANTFATSRYMLEAAGLGDKVGLVNIAAVNAALAARDSVSSGRDIWVAGSISPMAPYDDSEQAPDIAVMAASFDEQARILADAGVDFVALEMMRSIDHTRAAVDAVERVGLPLLLGYSCALNGDGTVVLAPRLGGEFRLDEVVGQVAVPEGTVVTIMHTDVGETLPALKVLRSQWAGRIGVYPHSGHFNMPHWEFDAVMPPEEFLEEARSWIGLGACVIGGCCGIGPEHIRVLAENLADNTGHRP